MQPAVSALSASWANSGNYTIFGNTSTFSGLNSCGCSPAFLAPRSGLLFVSLSIIFLIVFKVARCSRPMCRQLRPGRAAVHSASPGVLVERRATASAHLCAASRSAGLSTGLREETTTPPAVFRSWAVSSPASRAPAASRSHVLVEVVFKE